MIKEIKTNEVESLKPLMVYLAKHHNEVSMYFKGTYPRHSPDEKIAKYKEEIEKGTSIAYAYMDNDIPVGLIKFDLNESKGIIDYFVVLKDYKGKGIGKILMNIALDTYKQKGITNIQLHCVYGNNAVGFYEKCGFEIVEYIFQDKESRELTLNVNDSMIQMYEKQGFMKQSYVLEKEL